MFSGIVEALGTIHQRTQQGSNITFEIETPLAQALEPDQSIAHNGVCLTVENIYNNKYEVTAVQETLQKSNLTELKEGDQINLERSMTLNSFVDGHLVQGHVDDQGICDDIQDLEGSYVFTFSFDPHFNQFLVEKGSITVNGVSLTAFDVGNGTFSVTIVPYTYDHTSFKHLNQKAPVNLEFDLIGKYVHKSISNK